MNLLLATANAHKAEEVRAILRDSPFILQTLLDHPDLPDAPETGDTFVHNAYEKAEFIHKLTGIPVLADDSGIEVDALDGRPGVHSKRYSPEATHDSNNRLLLKELSGVDNRGARFTCVLALVTSHGRAHVTGQCYGHIAAAPQGEKGFGYDPLFMPDEFPGRSMAELSMDEKNQISHRGRAFAQLTELLAKVGLP